MAIAINRQMEAAAAAIDAALLTMAIEGNPAAEPFIRQRWERKRGVPADMLLPVEPPPCEIVLLSTERARRAS